jgi:hypothetical protein
MDAVEEDGATPHLHRVNVMLVTVEMIARSLIASMTAPVTALVIQQESVFVTVAGLARIVRYDCVAVVLVMVLVLAMGYVRVTSCGLGSIVPFANASEAAAAGEPA